MFTWDYGLLKSWSGSSQFHFMKRQFKGRSWSCLDIQMCYFCGIILNVVKTVVINALEKKQPCQSALTTVELSVWDFYTGKREQYLIFADGTQWVVWIGSKTKWGCISCGLILTIILCRLSKKKGKKESFWKGAEEKGNHKEDFLTRKSFMVERNLGFRECAESFFFFFFSPPALSRILLVL